MCLSVCLSVKSHLTYGASVRSENAVTYSTDNGGQKICGVFSEDAPLLRSSGAAVVFHTFKVAIFKLFIAKAVHMRIGIHSYGCRTAGEYPACQTIVNNIQPCPKRSHCLALVGRKLTAPHALQLECEAWPISSHAHWHSSQDSTRRGFCTLVLFIHSFLDKEFYMANLTWQQVVGGIN